MRLVALGDEGNSHAGRDLLVTCVVVERLLMRRAKSSVINLMVEYLLVSGLKIIGVGVDF